MLLRLLFGLLLVRVQGRNVFNQTAGFGISVEFSSWSNFGSNGGCVTCPYTCVKGTEGPSGSELNYTNATSLLSIPAAYTNVQMNGCCFAAKGKTKQAPDCNNDANPASAEDCGFLSGPSLSWDIQSTNPPEDPMRAVLFASIDCENFWAVGQTYIKQERDSAAGRIQGKKVIQQGCYGDPAGSAIVLAGCITSSLKYDKGKGYTWDMLAQKCMGLAGQCSRTNGLWGRNLKCCNDLVKIEGSKWDLTFEEYHKPLKAASVLSGAGVFFVVFGGVALLMCLVHYGAKLRERARQTALIREQEATDDYEEIVTPLKSDAQPAPLRHLPHPGNVDLSLHEGDEIFNQHNPELLYEGDMY